MAPKHITVLGGGLTGLTAAYRLAERLPSTEVVLLEATQRLGGWVDSQRYPIQYTSDGKDIRGEIVLEGGPRSIRPRGSRGAVKMLKLVCRSRLATCSAYVWA
jgi:oxygen-dependent protoporphyrinogen oxidase